MSVYIYQPDAFDRLLVAEGPRYLSEGPQSNSGYDFATYLEAWNRARSERLHWPDNVNPSYVGLPEGDGAIYGTGGYSRYIVRQDGEIVLLGSTASSATQERALAVGFQVVP